MVGNRTHLYIKGLNSRLICALEFILVRFPSGKQHAMQIFLHICLVILMIQQTRCDIKIANIKGVNRSLRWLVNLTSLGLNLTSRKIIYFTLHGEGSQNFGQKTGFKPIKYLYEPPIKSPEPEKILNTK